MKSVNIKENKLKNILNRFIRSKYDADGTLGKYLYLFTIDRKDQLHYFRTYSSCRGYIHESMQANYQHCYGTKRIYLCSRGTRFLNSNSLRLVKDFCKVLGYKDLEYYTSKQDEHIYSLDVAVFRNLYAVSFLFLIFKFKSKTRDSKTLKGFVQNYWATPKAVERVLKAINNWEELFPKRACTWSSMYGTNRSKSKNPSHHYEGMTELLQGKSKFLPIRKRVNKILGGVDEVITTYDMYNNPRITVLGDVSKINFRLK